jgi:hypothetical protein
MSEKATLSDERIWEMAMDAFPYEVRAYMDKQTMIDLARDIVAASSPECGSGDADKRVARDASLRGEVAYQLQVRNRWLDMPTMRSIVDSAFNAAIATTIAPIAAPTPAAARDERTAFDLLLNKFAATQRELAIKGEACSMRVIEHSNKLRAQIMARAAASPGVAADQTDARVRELEHDCDGLHRTNADLASRLEACIRSRAAGQTDAARDTKRLNWISVEDALPEIDHTKPEYEWCVKVLAHWGEGPDMVAEMEYAENPWAKTPAGKAPKFRWQGRNSPWTVTHWMPMPTFDAAKGGGDGQ